MKRLAFFCLLLVFGLAGLARADDRALIDRWFTALARADAAELGDLLSENAEVELADVGVTLGKAEFLDSMDEWSEAVKNATIRHRIEGEDGTVTTVLSCYAFPDNEQLVRETFDVREGLVARNVQTPVAESCAAF